jgi:hypothetical protein
MHLRCHAGERHSRPDGRPATHDMLAIRKLRPSWAVQGARLRQPLAMLSWLSAGQARRACSTETQAHPVVPSTGVRRDPVPVTDAFRLSPST